MAQEAIIDIVDESGNILRQAAKHDAHRHGWLHKTVIGHVRDGDDWAFVCQAADRQDAGQWVAPVGGHVRAKESDIDALLREAEEEIGVKQLSHKHLGTARFHRQVLGRDENHLFVVYEISTSDPIKLGAEAIDFKKFTTDELKRTLREQPGFFGDALHFAFEHFYTGMLPGDWVRRWS